MASSTVDSQPPATIKRAVAPRPTNQMTIGCVIIPVLVAVVIGAVIFRTLRNASAEITVPMADLLFVRSAPDESAPLLARFGAGHVLHVVGRTEDWRWLEVELWGNRHGWALRPLDILVWQIRAEPTRPQVDLASSLQLELAEERMIPIDGGTFTMGSPPGLGDEDESPAHVVTLSPFWIDQTEVTVGHYWQCVQANQCKASVASGSQTEPHYINDPLFDNHPMIQVPWSEAKAYCTWRGKRLLTEAEWEMAAGWDASLNAKLRWPWGNDPAVNPANVNARLADAASVGTYTSDRSPAGVLDMGGNVREWVLDWYKIDYYSVADDTDPTGPSNRRGEGTGRVVRGGHFSAHLVHARTADRTHEDPAYGYTTVGFRCAKDR